MTRDGCTFGPSETVDFPAWLAEGGAGSGAGHTAGPSSLPTPGSSHSARASPRRRGHANLPLRALSPLHPRPARQTARGVREIPGCCSKLPESAAGITRRLPDQLRSLKSEPAAGFPRGSETVFPWVRSPLPPPKPSSAALLWSPVFSSLPPG